MFTTLRNASSGFLFLSYITFKDRFRYTLNQFMFLQIEPIDPNAIPAEEVQESIRLFEVISRMGIVGWLVMAILFILLLLSVYLTVERYIIIKKAGKMDKNFMNQIKEQVRRGDIQAARAICLRENTPISRMIEKGVLRIGKRLNDVSEAVENVGNLEVAKLEKNLSTLATIAGAAPMLGFLGTVTGMISAFYNLSAAGNQIDTGLLAGGIYEALFTTAFGLAVGIVAFISYNWLVSLMQKVVFRMEANSVDFIDLIQEPTK